MFLNKKSKFNYSFSLFFGLSIKAAAMTLDSAASISEQFGEDPYLVDEQKALSTQEQNKWPLFNPNSLKNSDNFWLDGELLYWQSNMGSLSYGVTSKSSTRIDDGHVKSPHFNWDFGFRLGLGYKLPRDQWDLFVNYTYMHGSAHGHAGGSDRFVFPSLATNFAGLSPFYANSAHAHWKMHLNMADLELGRTCMAGKWVSIRPFLGVRGLVIDQDYDVVYKGGTIAPSDRDKVTMDSDFWGVGIRMGFDSLWGLGKGISLYGNGSVSLLSGNFDVHERERLQKTNVHKMDVKRDVDNVVATADLALGLQWDCLLSKDRYHFGVKFGWEFDIFFDQNQLFNFIGNNPGAFKCNNDDLTFQGLTLGFRFDF